MSTRLKGRAVPPRPAAEIEADIARAMSALGRGTEHAERRAALASGDPAQVRAWAERWGVPLLPCDDATLMESVRAAQEIEAANDLHARAQALDAACQALAAQVVAQPAHVRERLIASLERSTKADPLTREMERTTAAHARRLLGAEEVKTV